LKKRRLNLPSFNEKSWTLWVASSVTPDPISAALIRRTASPSYSIAGDFSDSAFRDGGPPHAGVAHLWGYRD
jgi:hypothetical protein